MDIKSLELEELTEQLVQMGLPKFRGGQVYSWLHENGWTAFEQMSNLSAALRQHRTTVLHKFMTIIQKAGVQNPTAPKSICCAWRTTTAWKRFLMKISMEIRSASPPGRLPHGMQILRIHLGGTGALAASFRRCSMKSTPPDP